MGVGAAVGFVGTGFAGLQDGAAGVEAAAWGDVPWVGGLARAALPGGAAANFGGDG